MAKDNASTFSVLEMAALVVLMAEAREVSNPEMKELTGFTLTGKERERLTRQGLVESRKGTRGAYFHQLTDKGWSECKNLSAGPLPARAGSAGGALFALLAGLHRSLDRLRISHGEFFKREAEPTTVTPTEPALESRVRAAYQALAEKPGDWVGLADLRDHLGDADRSDVDDALRRLARQPGVHLIPVANLKGLTDREHRAAIVIGEQANHTLSIEE
jgi:hypothetical protein